MRVSFSENSLYVIDDIKINQVIFKADLDDDLDITANKALKFLQQWK